MEGQALQYDIENIHQHPDFARNPAENNLALIELKRNVSYGHSFIYMLSTSHMNLPIDFISEFRAISLFACGPEENWIWGKSFFTQR